MSDKQMFGLFMIVAIICLTIIAVIEGPDKKPDSKPLDK